MDPVTNPFAPGAGTPPPELTGRDDLLQTVRVALARVRLDLLKILSNVTQYNE